MIGAEGTVAFALRLRLETGMPTAKHLFADRSFY